LLAYQSEAELILEKPALELAASALAKDNVRVSEGQQVGSYKILSLLGIGGMGEVYRARDSKLKRDVALKVLPDEFSNDTERLRRFRREAEVLASLNHPNIAVIYDVQQEAGFRYLVLELVEGENLSDRIKRGPVPVDEALGIAKQICEGLEAAHEKGIIHRDVKPANIKVTPNGRVKLLDFGLARILEERENPSPATMTSSTARGIILGTPGYMSPEQACGRPLDKRTDIFSFGCVLYELLTGSAPFAQETVTETIGAVLGTEPDWSRLPRETPSRVSALLRRCMQKDNRNRLRDIGDARIELERPAEPLDERFPDPADRYPTLHRRKIGTVVLGSLAVAAFVFAILYFRSLRLTAPSAAEVRFDIPVPPMSSPWSFSISPDGRNVAYVAAASDGKNVIWVRPLNALDARALSGTDGAIFPFWSSDGRFIGFPADGKLKRIEATAGTVQTLMDPLPGLFRRGTWSGDVILLSAMNVLYRMSASGGPPTPITAPDISLAERDHTQPQFLPDGRHFLYKAWSDKPENMAIYIGSLDSRMKTRIMGNEKRVLYAPPGFMLFLREQTLMAQPFDVDRLQFTGEARPIVEGVMYDKESGTSGFDASNDGVLVYRRGEINDAIGNSQFLWKDRTGRTMVALSGLFTTDRFRLAPDDKRFAFYRTVIGADIWNYDIERNVRTRLTTNALNYYGDPVWARDASRLIFVSTRGYLNSAVYEMPSNGVVPEKSLLEPEAGVSLHTLDWSLDGRLVVFSKLKAGDPNNNLWILPLTGDRKPFRYHSTSSDEPQAALSPNARWLAYVSNATGKYEIVVQPFPNPSAGKWQISAEGGANPRWRRDGRELYYLDPSGRIIAVQVKTDGNFEVGQSIPLFKIPSGTYSTDSSSAFTYDVTTDGQHFLVAAPASLTNSTPITVIQNWPSLLKH
jgi:serine/threonine protein kinase/Tol biopolymer transport system component